MRIERGAVIVHDYDEIEFKCECGKAVKLRRRVSRRSVKYVILCDGSVYRGHASKYAIFKNRDVQNFRVSHQGAGDIRTLPLGRRTLNVREGVKGVTHYSRASSL